MGTHPGRPPEPPTLPPAWAWLLLGGLALGCRGGEPPPGAGGAAVPTSEFRGVELVQQEADGSTWRLSAAEGAGWEGAGTGELRGIEGEIRRGGRTLLLAAGRAQVDERDAVHLSEGVQMTWGEYRAEVAQASYQRRRGQVTSDAAVLLEGPGLEVRGHGLAMDVEGRRVQVLADVRARIRGSAP